MSHRSDWGYYSKTTNQIAAFKGESCEDFIPALDRPSLFFFKQKQVFSNWPYSDIADAAFSAKDFVERL